MLIVPFILFSVAILAPIYFYLTKPLPLQHTHFGSFVCAEDTLFCPESQRKASEKMYSLLKDHENTFYDEEQQILGNLLLSENTFSRQPYVANGYIGSRIPNLGFGYALDTINVWVNDSSIPGALDNGWPLRNQRFAGAFISDFYCLQEKLNSTNFPELDDDGYSTVISTIPQWTDLSILKHTTTGQIEYINPTDVKLDKITNYMQNLSLQDGIVTTTFVYDKQLLVTTKVVAHRKIYPLGVVTLELSLFDNNSDTSADNENEYVELEICDSLNFSTSHRTVLNDYGYDQNNEGIFMVVEPENVPYSNASLFSYFDIPSRDTLTLSKSSDSISQCTTQILKANSTFVAHKYIGIISSEYDNKQPDDNSNGTSNEALKMSNLERATSIVLDNKGNYDSLIQSHKNAWKRIYKDASIEIPSDGLLEMTAKSSIYHLLANTRSHNVSEDRGLPIGVSGLSSDSYGGMVFWDSDLWILPALLPFFPNAARQINNYRNASLHQAKLNAEKYGYHGALYPWTSGRYANCTSTGPCVDYEYHINVDIALSSFAIYMNGDEDDERSEEYLRYTTWPFVENAAKMFAQYVKWNDTMQQYTTHNLTDPDEYANFVDNAAFTNAGIQSVMVWAHDIARHLGIDPDPQWLEIADNIHIPISETNITLEYSGMNSSVEIKQADVVLMIYPLSYITDQSILNNAIKNLYYYSERQSASGPAMTYPVFVAGAASLLNYGSSSQSYLYKSVVPYLRSPFAQFSEQSDDNFLTNGLTQPAFPFLTANGGFLQSILFGLTGLRYSYEVDEDTGKIHRLLKFNPIQLPLLPGGIRINNFKYMGQVLDVLITDTEGIIIHKNGTKEIRIKVPDRTLIPDVDVKYSEETDPIKQILHGRRSVPTGKNYFTIQPGDVFKTPLYIPKKNLEGNLVEAKQITNLTAGVPGDVAVSVIDGNNFTHWQPAYKNLPARLLIDMGNNFTQEIKSGKIIWGSRPAKTFSLSILPQTEEVFKNLTHILSNVNQYCNKTGDECVRDLERTEKGFDAAIEDVFDWYGIDPDSIISTHPELKDMKTKFVKILDHYKVTPSEPYPWRVYNESQIVLLPGNETDFDIDYSKVAEMNPENVDIDFRGNQTDWRKGRFIVLTVHDTYDDDDDEKGATIKEFALFP